MRVLIVDDQLPAQTALPNILSQEAVWSISIESTIRVELLGKLATDSYDVLLLDIALDLVGSQLVDRFRERNLPLPSIVVVTAALERIVRSKSAATYLTLVTADA
jgi:DNA-binding response OmpR family regulator